MTAKVAAAHANANAIKSKGRSHDDVTVLVIDFVPRQADAKAPGLLAKKAGGGKGGVQLWRPLETPSTSWRCAPLPTHTYTCITTTNLPPTCTGGHRLGQARPARDAMQVPQPRLVAVAAT
jgi:hypothetical protein